MHRVFSAVLALGLLAASVFATAVPVGADAGSSLPGSPFNGHDGVLDSNAQLTATDIVGKNNDNAFGNGSKEDQVNVSVVTGSIPPNKNDLTSLYVTGAIGSNNHVFAYIAWTRAVNIGSANLDIELNQNAFQLPASGATTLNRKAGDLLVLYDFGGSGTPVLSFAQWATSGGTCLVGSDSPPCWEAAGTAVVSESAVSSNGLLGEATVDLTASGLIPSGVCESFAQSWVKARSSTSLTAELKDFIQPGSAHINTCGATEVIKLVNKGSGNSGLNGAEFDLKDSGGTVVKHVTTATVGGSNGIACVDGLQQGTYTWTETKAPTGYQIDDTTPHTVNVNMVANCSDNTTGVQVATFFDTPLSQVEVKFTSLAGAGVTSASIVCTKGGVTVGAVSENGNADPAFDDTDETFTNLAPGTYNCQVVVDP